MFTSADAGMRKPGLCFFKFVQDKPFSVVFVDDQVENVLAARSLGMNGIIFDNVQRVRQTLRFFTGYPVSRGLLFLETRAARLESDKLRRHCCRNLYSIAHLGSHQEKVRTPFWMHFSSDPTTLTSTLRELVNYVHHHHTWNFFRGI